jgi:hypothetical protein
VCSLQSLEIAPEAFGWVECGRVPWHPLAAEPSVLLGEVTRHGRTLVGGEPVPEEEDPVAAEAALAALYV